jgi:hypothetical protein
VCAGNPAFEHGGRSLLDAGDVAGKVDVAEARLHVLVVPGNVAAQLGNVDHVAPGLPEQLG